MQQYLFDSFDIEISVRSIYDYLQRARWSRKVIQVVATEQSLPLRIAWQGLQPQWDDNQLVFLDESASNERTGDRRYGWSPVGVVCKVSRPLKRSEQWSILPALCNTGYIDWIVYQGAITADIFVEFLQERVLPHCTPYPGVRSVIILDNASIHKDRRILEACNRAGVLLKFLPPYSPDFNPIEATFKDLKAWIKLNYLRVEEFEVFSDFLEFAIQQVCRRDVRCHYRRSGYVVREV